MPDPAFGQWHARRELQAVEKLTGGGVRVRTERAPTRDDADLVVELIVDCSDRPRGPQAGAELKDAEQVLVRIPPDYPLRKPSATITHTRFARLPHVVWNSWICLYLSNDDWDPGHGMYGFVERLLTWFRDAAEGSLSGPDHPWEPPITGAAWHDGMLVVGQDVPDVLENDPKAWAATAVLERVGVARFALRSWIPGEIRTVGSTVDGLLAPVAALPEPVAFSYPRQLGELLRGVTDHQNGAFPIVATAVATVCDGHPGLDPARTLPLVLLLSPAPTHVPGGSRTAHIAAWWVDDVGRSGVDLRAGLSWMKVFDQRPRTTVRRDRSRPADWLRDKRVLLLGCGGLGAPTAEFCARSGPARLHLVDNAGVRPGVLVRQPFTVDDIGRAKVRVLAERLSGVAEGVAVTARHDDVLDLLAGPPEVLDVDIVIDTTASAAVAAALERIRWSRPGPRPPVLSMTVGHRCDLAVATLSMPAATGGGADVLRRLAVTATRDDSLRDVLDDLLPDPPRTQVFQPEPGCSDPTYVGSAADLASFAGQLLNQALVVLRTDLHPAAPARWAAVVRSPGDDGAGAAAQRLHWPADLTTTDPHHGYEVRLDVDAVSAIRGEIDRAAHALGPHAETGGLLLGQIDHASRVVWVDEAHGPPPGTEHRIDSVALHLEDAPGLIEGRLAASRGLTGLVGAWHTHPSGPSTASAVDQAAMDDIVAARHTPALLLVVGHTIHGTGDAARDGPSWWARLHFP